MFKAKHSICNWRNYNGLISCICYIYTKLAKMSAMCVLGKTYRFSGDETLNLKLKQGTRAVRS